LLKVEKGNGGIDEALVSWWDGISCVLDFSNPQAVEWYTDVLQDLVDTYGVSGFKFDATGARFFPGQDSIRNSKTVPFVKGTSPNEQSELLGKVGLSFPMSEIREVWKLAGQPLAQRLIDKRHRWSDAAVLISDSLAQGILGYSFTCPDMIGGGFWKDFFKGKKIDQKLVVRSAQIHALMPMMQFSIAPWRILDEEHLEAVKKAVEIRKEFTPAIMTLVDHAAKTGEPILRHMEYVFPNQGYHNIKDQFLLGDHILVAPIISDKDTRRVILPRLDAGQYWKGFDGKTYESGTVVIEVGLDELAYFIREK